MVFEWQREVPESDLNKEYLHIHHARSLVYLEEGRCEYLKRIGFPLTALMARGLFLVVSKIEVQYLREVRNGAYVITCEEPAVEGKRAALRQRLVNDRSKVCLDAIIEFAMIDGRTRRAVVFPDAFVQGFYAGTTGLV